jgi:predicted nucleic acid-binding protein
VIIVSDTSPINNLAAIGQLHLLKALYEQVVIPEAVYQELTSADFPVAGSIEVQTLDWIKTQAVTNQTLLISLGEELDPGEAAAIVLALELQATQLLIDERRGRFVAERFELSYTGVLGILIEAKHQNLIPAVKPLLDALINQAGFWIAAPLYERVLQVVEER